MEWLAVLVQVFKDAIAGALSDLLSWGIPLALLAMLAQAKKTGNTSTLAQAWNRLRIWALKKDVNLDLVA